MPVGAYPIQSEGLHEYQHAIHQARTWPERVGEGGRDVDRPWLEESFPPQERDEVRHRPCVQVARSLEVLEDQFAHRQRAVHPLRELRLPYLELEVDQSAWIRDHRVVVAPPEPEDPHLDVAGERRSEPGELHLLGERFHTSMSAAGVASALLRAPDDRGPGEGGAAPTPPVGFRRLVSGQFPSPPPPPGGRDTAPPHPTLPGTGRPLVHSGTAVMNKTDLIEQAYLRSDIPEFRPGDTVKVHVRVVEGNRERVQVFQGVVIRRQNGGLRETFTVRKISFGVGVERTFPCTHPPSRSSRS